MLLAANYLLTFATETRRCVIYSSEEIVVQQIAEKIKIFPMEDEFIVTSDWNPIEWRASYPNAIFVIDEAETAIATRLIDL